MTITLDIGDLVSLRGREWVVEALNPGATRNDLATVALACSPGRVPARRTGERNRRTPGARGLVAADCARGLGRSEGARRAHACDRLEVGDSRRPRPLPGAVPGRHQARPLPA